MDLLEIVRAIEALPHGDRVRFWIWAMTTEDAALREVITASVTTDMNKTILRSLATGKVLATAEVTVSEFTLDD
jgi:hypothetical protein